MIKTTRGAALTEYGLLVGLVAVVAIGAVAQLGVKVDATFVGVSSSLASISDEGPDASPHEGDREPEGPPPATGAAAMSFTVTMNDSFREYGHPSLNSGSAESGRVESYEGVPPYLIQLRYETGSNRVFFRVAGNFQAELVDHVLSCSDGLSLALNDAGNIYYEPPKDRTMAYWEAVPDSYLIEGSTISCRVSDS